MEHPVFATLLKLIALIECSLQNSCSDILEQLLKSTQSMKLHALCRSLCTEYSAHVTIPFSYVCLSITSHQQLFRPSMSQSNAGRSNYEVVRYTTSRT